MASNAAKVRAVAEGAVIGGGTTVAVGVLATRGLQMLTRAAPTLGVAAGRALPVVGVGIMAAGVISGGVQAWRRGDNVAGGMVRGFLGIAPAEAKTIRERQKELADKNGAGGDPEVYRRISENSRRNMERSKTSAERNAQERRALLAEEKYEQLTGKHIGPTDPEPTKNGPASPPAAPAMPAPVVPGETWGQRMLRKSGEVIENAVFGERRAKAEDSMDKERKQLEGRLAEQQRIARIEFEQRGGDGPKYRQQQKDIADTQRQLGDLTNRQAAKEREELAAYRNVAAVAVGAAAGVLFGRMAHGAAEKTVAAAESGINKLATKAATLVNASKKGVIAGTIEGDKAAAAVSAAKAAMAKQPVSAVSAYGLPALNLAHGAGAYAWSATHPDDPTSPLLRMEGAAAIAAGVVGMKYGMAARAMRPLVSPAAMGKLQSAEKRLMREVRVGPAGVAKAKAAAAVGSAQKSGRAAVAVAGNRAAGRVAASKIDAHRPAVTSGARLGVAKAEGASRVGVAEARGKQAVSRQVARGQTSNYKDTWQDSKGRVYHRKDMSVRKPSARRARFESANDNTSGRSGRARRG